MMEEKELKENYRALLKELIRLGKVAIKQLEKMDE